MQATDCGNRDISIAKTYITEFHMQFIRQKITDKRLCNVLNATNYITYKTCITKRNVVSIAKYCIH